MGAHSGGSVMVEYAIAEETANPATLTRKRLGMMRGKGIDISWDTIDTTGDMSPGYTKTSMVSFKQGEFSGDGVSYDDAIYNQRELFIHSISPSSVTGGQPKLWLFITYPDVEVYGPFVMTKMGRASSNDDATTWKMAASTNGELVALPI